MGRQKSKVQMATPEEKIARATRARKRFRAAARLAFVNQFWLEDLSDMKLGDNVLKNIRLLTQKTKKKSKFTLEQKMIMNTAKDKRTAADKKKLHRVLAGLRCFRRYPSSVKEQLAEVTYFLYLPPKKTVVRQDDDAKALFFLLSGEVQVYQRVFDKVLNEWLRLEVGTREAGSMFGEVSLLHGVKRTATVVTSDHCELLVLRKEDFDAVLKSTVMAEWNEIQRCMSLFSYFDNWDVIAVRDCCILSKVKYYGIDDIVLSEDIGDKKFVYFIVEGQCDIIEHLELEVTRIGCKRTFKLLSHTSDDSFDKDDETYFAAGPVERQLSTMSNTSLKEKEETGKTLSHLLMEKQQGSGGYSDKIRTTTIKTHFIRIGTIHQKATFNIGEQFRRRYVVASKKTKILMIPRYWLVQKNKEIWSNIRQFLNRRLPNTKAVFRDFIQQQKWQVYRSNLVQEILSLSKKVNLNNIHNIPYSIRIQEDMSNYECERRMNR